jgi:hypothetical protein
MEVSGQLHAPAALLPGNKPVTDLMRLGGPQSRFGRFGEEKNTNIKIYTTIIVPVLLHGCETWSLTLAATD